MKKAAFESGLICYPMGGTVDGVRGDHVLLAPAFIIENSHVTEIVDKLDRAFKSVFRAPGMPCRAGGLSLVNRSLQSCLGPDIML